MKNIMDKSGELIKLDLDVSDIDCKCCNSTCNKTKDHTCCPLISCLRFWKKKRRRKKEDIGRIKKEDGT